jgi:hypothetical protein
MPRETQRKVRRKTGPQGRLQDGQVRRQQVAAARELLACYASLAAGSSHLLDGVLRGRAPVQWRHYPATDVIDRDTGYQYFYHCHAPGERAGGPEHGHFHLFRRAGPADSPVHLLAIALTAKGVPHALFTVNQWVTANPLPSARAALGALSRFEMRSAGDPLVNRWMAALLRLFRPEIAQLLAARDRRLRAALPETGDFEVLSSIPIDVDARLRRLESRAG